MYNITTIWRVQTFLSNPISSTCTISQLSGVYKHSCQTPYRVHVQYHNYLTCTISQLSGVYNITTIWRVQYHNYLACTISQLSGVYNITTIWRVQYHNYLACTISQLSGVYKQTSWVTPSGGLASIYDGK